MITKIDFAVLILRETYIKPTLWMYCTILLKNY